MLGCSLSMLHNPSPFGERPQNLTFVWVKSAFGLVESWASPEQKAHDLSVAHISMTRNQAIVIENKEPLALQWHSSKCTFPISL